MIHSGEWKGRTLAMERILQKPVDGAVLWYLRKKQAVEVPLGANAEPNKKTVAFSEKV